MSKKIHAAQEDGWEIAQYSCLAYRGGQCIPVSGWMDGLEDKRVGG